MQHHSQLSQQQQQTNVLSLPPAAPPSRLKGTAGQPKREDWSPALSTANFLSHKQRGQQSKQQQQQQLQQFGGLSQLPELHTQDHGGREFCGAGIGQDWETVAGLSPVPIYHSQQHGGRRPRARCVEGDLDLVTAVATTAQVQPVQEKESSDHVPLTVNYNTCSVSGGQGVLGGSSGNGMVGGSWQGAGGGCGVVGGSTQIAGGGYGQGALGKGAGSGGGGVSSGGGGQGACPSTDTRCTRSRSRALSMMQQEGGGTVGGSSGDGGGYGSGRALRKRGRLDTAPLGLVGEGGAEGQVGQGRCVEEGVWGQQAGDDGKEVEGHQRKGARQH